MQFDKMGRKLTIYHLLMTLLLFASAYAQALLAETAQTDAESVNTIPLEKITPSSDKDNKKRSLNLSLPGDFALQILLENNQTETESSSPPNLFDSIKQDTTSNVNITGKPFIDINQEHLKDSTLEGGQVNFEIKTR